MGGNPDKETGRVVDLRVTTNRPNGSSTPFGMEVGLDKYIRHSQTFHQALLSVSQEARRKRVNLTEDLHVLVREALIEIDPGTQERPLIKYHRKKQIDEIRLDFVIEHLVEPTIGHKHTDFHGGKGVECVIVEDGDMPTDADGNEADMCFDPKGRFARMNPGGNIEHFLKGYQRDLVKELRKGFGFAPGSDILPSRIKEADLRRIKESQTALYERSLAKLLRFYEITSPILHEKTKEASERKLLQNFHKTLKEGLQIYWPINNPVDIREVGIKLLDEFNTCYGPVRYRDLKGEMVTTVEKVRVARMYIISLEKIGSEWNAVSSAVLQPHGLIAQKTKAHKYSSPARKGATRVIGETEGRILVSYTSALAVAEVFDRNNSPTTHRAVCEALIRADIPTNINNLVDRTKYPYGSGKPLQIVNHMLSVGGTRFIYNPDSFKPITND